MKQIKTTLFFFTILFSIISCNNTDDEFGIYNGDIIFSTQKQIDDFGENNYTKVTGSVTIGDRSVAPTSEINNLNGLSKLVNIDKDLYITNNKELSNLEGLNNLVSIKDVFL
ncbi:MAG: hypothetical protein P8I51_08815 [Polaribacter sp.]|nr:hypothetical protein [Polaribacter sp.]MDG1954976.1 hypothetical protein [Polaribacter sp.]MDG2074648.1 hypothetical protein [Polaribacter sp.]